MTKDNNNKLIFNQLAKSLTNIQIVKLKINII